MKEYNKLVRDKIPNIIKNSGKNSDTEIAEGKEKTEDKGFSEEELIKKREEKKEDRGGFKKGIILKKVY